jgi:uncharacterized YccA/Bax inhibitor family protein
MANPALSNSPAFRNNSTMSASALEEMYRTPSATAGDMGRMTYEDTAVKTVVLFAVLLATGAVGWFVPALAVVGAIAGLVLALVNTFKRVPSVPLIIGYAAAEGLFVGGISSIFEQRWGGVVIEAVTATLVTFAVTLVLFAFKKVRATPRATRIFLIAIVGYLVFRLVEAGIQLFGGTTGTFGLSSTPVFGIPLGVIIGVLAVLLAAYSLVLDFDQVQQGVRRGLPARYGWQAAFGLMVTIVWLYTEFLRIFALFRNN